MRHTCRLSADNDKFIRETAEKLGITLNAALNSIVALARGNADNLIGFAATAEQARQLSQARSRLKQIESSVA
jgi:hypothetical protein